MNKKYSIFHIEGGLGKHLMATAVAKCIKNNYPDRKLIIVCAYPEVFINLDFIDRVYAIGHTPYFYEDYIENGDSLIFRQEPYFATDYIYQKEHLIQSWCKLLNLNYTQESPTLLFNRAQSIEAQHFWKRDKPIMVIHTNGGPSDQSHTQSWVRDIPYLISTTVADYYREKYHIIQVARENSLAIPGAEVVTNVKGSMLFLSLLLFSQKRLLIDSSLQHAASILNKKSTVLWIGNSPKVFGYKLHDNIQSILPSTGIKPDSYLHSYNIQGTLYECPIIEETMFNIEDIILSIENQ